MYSHSLLNLSFNWHVIPTSLLIFIFFKHNHTPSGKKTVTGIQVVTTSQVQIISCRSKAILQQWCVCVAVTTLAYSNSIPKAHVEWC